MRFLSKKWLLSIFVLIILGLLNPNYTDFKEFTGLTGKNSQALHKKYNFFICSIYENDFNSKRYLAFLKNFIDITPQQKKIESNNSKEKFDTSLPALMDSSRLITDTTLDINSSSPEMNDSEFNREFQKSFK